MTQRVCNGRPPEGVNPDLSDIDRGVVRGVGARCAAACHLFLHLLLHLLQLCGLLLHLLNFALHLLDLGVRVLLRRALLVLAGLLNRFVILRTHRDARAAREVSGDYFTSFRYGSADHQNKTY